MSDEIDQAQHLDEEFRQQAITAHFAGLHSREAGPASGRCIDCGERIKTARRRAMPNAVRCVDCQTRHERNLGRMT